jgi:hypothetical protein
MEKPKTSMVIWLQIDAEPPTHREEPKKPNETGVNLEIRYQ